MELARIRAEKTKAAASLEETQAGAGSRHKASSPPGPSSDTFLVAQLRDQALDPTAGAQLPPAGAWSRSRRGAGGVCHPGTSPTFPWPDPPPQGLPMGEVTWGLQCPRLGAGRQGDPRRAALVVVVGGLIPQTGRGGQPLKLAGSHPPFPTQARPRWGN